MRVENIFLILLFVLSLFISCKNSYKESDRVVFEYYSNSSYGSINLNLINGYNSFSLKYDLYSGHAKIETQFEGENGLLVRDINLAGSSICILSDNDKTVYKLDKLWGASVDIDFANCVGTWKELANNTGEKDLYFFFVTVNKESGLEKNYDFKVSTRNLISFIESVELVNINRFSTNVG
ncbi:hypothetical protein F0310_05015 (plasmid) [Borrelia sp. A-FGy1]|uniref:hypothetical protein n=1 Tax=Borrelia sp. A-FGy1 TaxID=2608247 RepID=UPI0015F3D5C2|nr:hypothetical protein [Borrelia sp. A-FGy1]QMU99778.1 hypothetical protein F0310_05015 [Borrelia sp. A-FGy1]